ncbi:MAG: PilZ domain-containing protein [Thermodesulfobacteriota bacterium]
MEQENYMDHRQHPRTERNDMSVDFSDAIGFSTGAVKDISRFGICIGDIPRKLHFKNGIVEAVISGRGHNFRLKLRQMWVKEDGYSLMIGVAIDNVPWSWTEMVMKCEPDKDDVWSTQ